MATLQFTKQGDFYTAEFTANADYALHIEREEEGRFFVYQRTGSSGEYFPCALPSNVGNAGKVLDYSFGHGVYPMNVRLVSETPVKIAERQEAQ